MLVLSPAFRAFIEFLRPDHLDELADRYYALLRSYNPPLLKLFESFSEDQIRAGNRANVDMFLGQLLDGTALERAQERLRDWEADRLPGGIPKASFQPRDLLLVSAAHEGAMVSFLDDYTDDRATALAVAREIREYYRRAEVDAYEVFTRIRDEEMQVANEELATQAEELEAHHEELVTANEQLNQTAAALAERGAFVENLVKHVPAGIAYLDDAHVFRWVNPEFASFAQQPVSAFPGRSYYEVFPFMENPNPRLQAALESGEPRWIPGLPVTSPDGAETFWDMVYVPVRGAGGHVDGLILMAQEATVRVRSQQLQREQIAQLQEVDRLKDQFLSILSHELRTPINAIMGFASILDDEVPGALNPDQHRYLQRILDGSDVLLGLIEDLLDMSRIQAGKFSLSPATVDPRIVLEEAIATLQDLAARKGQRLALELPASLAPIEADPRRLRQVVTNLVGNAIKFGPADDVIRIRARQDADGLHVEVEDHGEGIRAADIPRLFQRFTQLDGSPTRRAGGVGLGLSIVKALVEAHGGEVGVRSEPGVQTVFSFRLPGEPPRS